MRFPKHHTQLLQAAVVVAVVALSSARGAPPAASWPQWGGPSRNFSVDAPGLAESWPAEGPRHIWSRPLGEGYSAISAVDGRLFTMVRRGEREVALALDAANGKTIWEYAYDAPFSREYSMENGPGPHSEPLVTGGRVFTTGATGILHAFDAATGKVLWSHNLLTAYNGTLRVNGYACSPIAYGDTVIVMVGGKGHAVMAFRQGDGSVAWQSQDFHNSASSPLLINVNGQDQLVAFLYAEIVALDPRDGALLWSHPHRTEYGLNVSMPVWGPDNLLFLSSTYGGGSRVLRLTQSDGKTKVEEVWAHNLMRVHFTNVVRIGNLVYASSGDFGPAPLTALHVKTGQVAWRHRGLGRATLLAAGSRLIALEEDGALLLGTPTAEGFQVHSKAAIMANNAWTVPTLVGTTLYLRDRKNIMALDLGAPGGDAAPRNRLEEHFSYYLRDGGIWRQDSTPQGGAGESAPVAYIKKYDWGPGHAMIFDDTFALMRDGTCRPWAHNVFMWDHRKSVVHGYIFHSGGFSFAVEINRRTENTAEAELSGVLPNGKEVRMRDRTDMSDPQRVSIKASLWDGQQWSEERTAAWNRITAEASPCRFPGKH